MYLSTSSPLSRPSQPSALICRVSGSLLCEANSFSSYADKSSSSSSTFTPCCALPPKVHFLMLALIQNMFHYSPLSCDPDRFHIHQDIPPHFFKQTQIFSHERFPTSDAYQPFSTAQFIVSYMSAACMWGSFCLSREGKIYKRTKAFKTPTHNYIYS